jgi:hypothetical protein
MASAGLNRILTDLPDYSASRPDLTQHIVLRRGEMTGSGNCAACRDLRAPAFTDIVVTGQHGVVLDL